MISKPAFAAALLLLGSIPAFTQEIEVRPLRPLKTSVASLAAPVIRASSELVLVPVHVTDRTGASVSGLRKDTFTVFEDKALQTIVSFGNEDVPCSLGVVLDLSGSMTDKLSVATSALHAFFEAANPEDEAFLLTVSTRPESLSGFTSDFGLLEGYLPWAKAGGATALADTIELALQRMRAAHHPRKALLVISDGMDNHSRFTTMEVMRRVEEADVQVYTIGVQTWSPFKKPIELTEERAGLSFLRDLSAHSGGLNWTIAGFSDAPATAAQAGRVIRDQYVIAYQPPLRNDSGKWRSIQVRVNLPQAHVSARTGYYSH